jgi:2-octaprenyl-6-methoxyphenol hydroxylase
MKVTHIQCEYDVVVAGGGMVGGSFALLLARLSADRPLRVLVVDANKDILAGDSQRRDADFDARSTAVSWGSRLIYETAGLWPALAEHATPIVDIHVSDRGHFGAARLHAGDLAVPALGYVLENRDLGNVINHALADAAGVEYMAPASVLQVTPRPSGVALTISAADCVHEVQVGLLVLADGGRSGLCEQLGIVQQQKHYGQQALICNIAFEKFHQGKAFERFTDTGPLAVLPLSDHAREHRGALVWTLPEHQAREVTDLPEAAFCEALQQRFGRRLGRIRRAGARSLYPLSLTLAQEQIRPGIVLLGNAAHTLHPVAGQGLNLALRDARTLAELLVHAPRMSGHEATGPEEPAFASYALLQKFLDAQFADQQRTVAFSDLTTRLFSNNNPWLAAGRNLGLLGMDLSPPLKNWFTRQAMGMADRTTRW